MRVIYYFLSEAMPQTPKGRSGDLGEILATELVEEEIGLRVPVRRLRYKDGRNMAMRGDDFIGAGYDGAGEKVWLLKGEAKSNKVLGKATVTSARKVLEKPMKADDDEAAGMAVLWKALAMPCQMIAENAGEEEVPPVSNAA